MSPSDARPRVLLAGGGSGLLGRALLPELSKRWRVRSVHRRPRPNLEPGAEVVAADLAAPFDVGPLLDGVDAVVNVAWYRAGSERKFRELFNGLSKLLDAARARDVPFVQVSVPMAPPSLEANFPYLVYKRRLDAAVRDSGVPYAVVRPAMLFGSGDVLLSVMLRTIRSYSVFPMFGDGAYRVSPVGAADVARLIAQELAHPSGTTIDCGGPTVVRYHDLTDRMFALLGKRPRYWRMTERNGRRLARLLESLGSTRLYEYEVEWLVSDLLGVPYSSRMPAPPTAVEPYLRWETERLTGRPAPDLGPLPANG